MLKDIQIDRVIKKDGAGTIAIEILSLDKKPLNFTCLLEIMDMHKGESSSRSQ